MLMMNITVRILVITLASLLSTNANAWFFIFPIPNLAKPGPLQATIDALEKSTETRALAFNSEDKTFGSKQWVWGSYAGEVSQEKANVIALERCENSLKAAKAQSAGGQPLYSFGDKNCELHPFTPNDGPKIAEAKRKAAEAESGRLAAIEEARRVAVEEERKRIAAEEEQKRLSAEEESRRIASEEEQKRVAAEEEAKRTKGRGAKKEKASDMARQTPLKSPTLAQIDYEVEANKAAKILGCQPTQVKVTGAEGGNIQYTVACIGSKALKLSCDASGLCLQYRPTAILK
jgi:hypothetical protein